MSKLIRDNLMATRSNNPFDESLLANHETSPEKAPSEMVADRYSLAQMMAFIGLFLLIVGSLSVYLPRDRWSYVLPAGWGVVFLSLGTALMLYHCFADPEYQLRRVYGSLAMLMGLVGCGVCAIPASAESFGPYWLTLGVPLLTISPLFAVGVLRHEDDASWRWLLQTFLGVIFLILLGGCLLGLSRNLQFMASGGAALLVLTVVYAACYIGTQDADSDRGYYAGFALGVLGMALIVGGVIGSFAIEQFLVPNGLTLIGVGILMGIVSVGTCSDSAYVVLTRRELAAYFYSPIAYFVMLAMLAVFTLSFWLWVAGMAMNSRGQGSLEPIIRNYFFGFVPVLILVVFIPIVTMRLFSEEKRAGSLEVLLTAPVRDSTVVLSKFTAAYLFSLLMWLPAFLFLFSLRIFNPVEFDYRPILSFGLVLMATNFNFVAMGLFCSSLTSNQVIAAVLAFAGMVVQTLFFFYQLFTPGTFFFELFRYVSYLELWHESLSGNVVPRQLFLHVSIGVFFLFLTNLVLNSRKWK